MSASVVAGLGAAVVLTVAGHLLRRHNSPSAVRSPVTAIGITKARERRAVFGRVGRWALNQMPSVRNEGSRPDTSSVSIAEEALGGVIVAAGPAAVFDLKLGAGVAVIACALPWLRRRRLELDERQRVLRELPEIVDLLSVAVGGGLTIPMAITAVGERVDGVVSAALADSVAAAKRGRRLADVLELVPDQLGDTVRPLFRALVSAERYGTPIADALVRIATDLRIERRRFAETTARRLPVKLLFPLVVCILPAFVLLTVVPVLVSSLASLRN